MIWCSLSVSGTPAGAPAAPAVCVGEGLPPEIAHLPGCRACCGSRSGVQDEGEGAYGTGPGMLQTLAPVIESTKT